MKRDVKAFSADDLLAIPVEEPERLFTGELTTMKLEWKHLRSKWHTDHSGRNDVFQHVKILFEKAELKMLNGVWEVPGEFRFTDITGFSAIVQHVKKRTFELGDYYIGKSDITYSIDKSNKDLVNAAQYVIKGLTFKTDIEQKLESFFPLKPAGNTTVYETADRLIVRTGRVRESICLRDLLEHQGGKIDPKHVAWIISRLYNFACYLQVNKLTHNDFSLDSLYVTPDDHNVSLIGGWWYSRIVGEKLLAASSNTVKLIPMSILSKKMADPVIDLNLIRGVGRALLGDVVGTTLVRDKTLPKPMVAWLLGASAGDARKEYKTWHDKVLVDSFGPRKFVKLDVTFDNVYGK